MTEGITLNKISIHDLLGRIFCEKNSEQRILYIEMLILWKDMHNRERMWTDKDDLQ
jgi:hypothetical protein